MRYVFYHWVACEECDGTNRRWVNESGILATRPCGMCFGGSVERRMTKAEVLAAIEANEKASVQTTA